eukprot:CAMPEP_0183713788 /NCGR_PEP_ID=MMETSP0737-20130205/8536_1 /TAXON_ID=385413 /ORGANISM="Thalassiosira miniscula, Strain CCMP1093" /LENGTH=345 /DNA_ID=CAMNT_0025942627 /DNA_START=617 /DNA_END=1657 /DNA_ORIENTATION=-
MVRSRHIFAPLALTLLLLCFLPGTSALFGNNKKGFLRINVPLVGVDLLLIKDAETIKKATSSGDLVRIDAVTPDANNLQWLIRNFLSNARFYSKPFGWFMPMREKNSGRTKAYLDTKFKHGAFDVSGYAKDAVDVLLNKKKNKKSDEALQSIFVNALGARFFLPGEEYEPEVIKEARKALPNIADSLNPLKHRSSRKAVKQTCTYVRDECSKTGDIEKYNLPKDCPMDIAHPLFVGVVDGPDCLRKLAEDPSQSVETAMCQRDKVVKNIPRMVKKDSTFGGLLPETKPAYVGKTVILLGIGGIAAATNDRAFAFGTGSKDRRCAAEPAIFEFLEAVKKELQSRTN